jgi:DNA-binding CsgD family transcriptional regulator
MDENTLMNLSMLWTVSHMSFCQLSIVGLEALDVLGIGFVVCSGSGRLLLANRTAEGILKDRDGLKLDSDGVLDTTQESSPKFVEVVRRAIAMTPSGRGAGGAALAVRRASGRRALTVLVRSVNQASQTDASTRPAALVLILDPALSVKTAEIELGQLYGLSLAEARLANLLMDGKTLNDCAYELGIRRSTAQAHLKHLFKKTRVRRQSKLVSLLLRSIGLARLREITDQLMPTFARPNAHLSEETRPDLAEPSAV